MKHATMLLACGLAASAALNAALLSRRARAGSQESPRDAAPAASSASFSSTPQKAPSSADAGPPGAGAARLPRWEQLHDSDLARVLANLRAAGFPEPMIRGAITALADERFKQRQREVFGEPQPDRYWQRFFSVRRSGPEAERWRELHRERQQSLLDLLGVDPDIERIAPYRRRELSFVPEEKLAAVLRIERDYDSLAQEIRAESNLVRLPEDAEKAALLAREKHADLAALLNPAELEAYDMYRSRTAQTVRERYAPLFQPSEAEFRAIVALRKAYDERYGPEALSGATAASREERTRAEEALRDQLRTALGDARYTEFERAGDDGYRAAVRLSGQYGLPPENAAAVYEVQRTMTARAQEIYRIPRTEPERRAAAAREMLREAETALTPLLTESGLAEYKVVAGTWLRNLERHAQTNPPATNRGPSAPAAP